MHARLVSRITVAAVLVAAFGALSASPAAAQANAVAGWNEFAARTLLAFPGPAGGAPPASQVHMGMVQGAVYDAVNAIEPRRRPYLLERRFDPRASKDAAVATAAFRMLSSIITTVPATIAFPSRASLLTSVGTEYATALALIPDSPFKTEGINAGNAAADAMIAARADDGRFGPSQWLPNRAPGHWWPLSNPDGALMLDPTPWVGGVKPFLMMSSSQFRTDGPQDLRSAAWAEDFNEVKAFGSVNSTARTPEQTHIAIFWQSSPVAAWNAVARNLLADPRYAADTADSARLFAMLNLTGADSSINCWNDKYYWDFWRPWNAIHRAAEDGNPATAPDPNWTALVSVIPPHPPYPDHPSGHLCLDGAYLRVLPMFFGTDKIRFGVTSVQFPGETRYYDRFSRALREIIDARIWLGLHYRTADVQAQVLGKKVAHYMAKHYFQPVK